LGVVEPAQQDQGPAVVDHRDHHADLTLAGRRLRRVGDLLRRGERERLLVEGLRARSAEAERRERQGGAGARGA
jgi:hypothetical protein